MERIKLCDRKLPDYTMGEEIFNTVSHIVGAAFGVVVLVICVVVSALSGSAWAIVGSAIYGSSMIILYTISSVYHGLSAGTGKKVMQILDHCSIYYLIAGTYTPILLCAIRKVSPVWCWVLFGIVWGLACTATVFTAIDLKKYAKMSMSCYIGMGWCIVMALKPTLQAMPLQGFMWILAGGIAYTIGAVLFGIGTKVRYMHSVFHLFVVAGSILQFFGIVFYVI